MTTPIDTTRLRALLEAVTPGPWAWYGDLTSHRVYLATVKGGRRFVMDFRRWGFGGAQPRFQVGGIMRAAADLATREAPYRGDIAEIDHPDARFIAAMNPTTVRALLDEVEGLRARPTWERVLRLAEGSHDYGGGYHGGEYEAFQHGISTVCNVLKAASKQGDKADMQLRVVEAIGTDAMREPEEGGTP